MRQRGHDDGWLLDLLAVEIRLNDPRAVSTCVPIEQPATQSHCAQPEEKVNFQDRRRDSNFRALEQKR